MNVIYILYKVSHVLKYKFKIQIYWQNRSVLLACDIKLILFRWIFDEFNTKNEIENTFRLVMEEAPESYKNVTDVVDTCHAAGISKKCIKLRPIGVIKG